MTKAQIIVVEDENIVALDLRNRLTSLGYNVPAVAASGEDAIAKAAQHRPDLVLMDIKLKGQMDGIEAAEQIRSQFHIPVVYLTAYADDATLQRARITHPFGYIIKPFEERDLSATIEMALYRHEMERKLRESERWLSTTLRSIGDAVITTDDQGRISFINPIAETLTGWTQAEALGQPLTHVFRIISEETRTATENPVAEALQKGTVVGLRNHTLLIAKDGTETPIDDSAAPIRDDRGRITGVVLVFRDVSERSQAREALRQRTTQLETLREVGLELAAQLDLNTLLNSIVSRAMELLGGTASGLTLYRPERDVLEAVMSVGDVIVPIGTTFRRGEGFSGKVWETGKPQVMDNYEQWDGRAAAPDGVHIPIPALVGVPVCWGKDFLGTLAVRADAPHTFSPADVELLGLLATQAAIAIRNVRLYEAERKRAAQLAVVNQVARKAVSILDPDLLLQEIVAAIQQGFNYHNVTLFQLDETTHELGWQAMAGGFVDLAPPGYRQSVGEGLIGRAAETGQPLLVNDVSQDPRYVDGFSDRVPTQSEMCVPLRLGDRVIGVLDIQETHTNAFDETDLMAMETLADQIAVAIENARLFQEERKQRERAQALQEAAMAITGTLQVDEVIDRILAQLQEVVPYDTASVQLLRENGLEIVGGRGFPNLEELLGVTFDPNRTDNPNREVVRTRAPFIVADAPAVYEEFNRDPHAPAGIRSWLGVPMLVGERLIGMIALDKGEPAFYTQPHARLAQAFAAQAAIALENSRLFQGEREQRELAQALEEAAAAVGSTLHVDEVLDRILEQVERIVAGDTFNIMLVENEVARTVRQRGYDRLGLRSSTSRVTMPVVEYPSLLKMTQTGAPVLIQNTVSDPDWVPSEGKEWRRSYVAAPIQIRDRTVGFLNVNGTRPGQFSPADAWQLQAFANHAAVAIENARLYRELLNYAEQLEQRVQARTAELQAQYARLDAILNSTTDGIIVADQDGNVIQANPVAHTWLTHTLAPEEATRLKKAVCDVAMRAKEQPVALLELKGLDLELSGARILQPEGEAALRQIQTRLHQASQGEPQAVVALHDVSHLKAMDRIRTRFVTNVSHELRTPITAIKLYAHLMQRQPEKWQEYLKTLTREADLQAHLVEDILQISRIDAGRLEMHPCPTPLDELIQTAVARHQVLAQESGLTLEYRPSPPKALVLVDPERMTQVLNNLIGNAIRYTPAKGTVTVSSGRMEAERRTWATVTVADTGIGIPAEDLPHIFARFFRGEEPRRMQLTGTGLGLAIVKEIVELHGGRVAVESQESVGSTFTVWLPLTG